MYSISAYLGQRIAALWTHGQNAYASIVRIIHAEYEKNGIEESKERKAESEESCSRSTHS